MSSTSSTRRVHPAAAALAGRFREVRAATEGLVAPLEVEDMVVQSMPDVSPTKWHLAHVTWFFETFVLRRFDAGYVAAHPGFEYLFNSYYNAIGDPYPRPRRGLITRPTVREVLDYRARVEERLETLLEQSPRSTEMLQLVELGLQHEQQHQELILMDIKHVLSCNPLYPAYLERSEEAARATATPQLSWVAHPEGLREIGDAGEGFAFDSERPLHRAFVPAFLLASRAITNGEYREFVESGGYRRPEHWLADGWSTVLAEGWQAPLYWLRRDGEWLEFKLGGLGPLDPAAPVCHVSYYEADAYARWAGARLPTEQEWETAAADLPLTGNFQEDARFTPRPCPAAGTDAPLQLYGDVWEWTSSPFAPYPGFRPAAGAVGEYNGKFMCNQQVLRGGCCVTPRSHVRRTYRNFFYPHCRWQFAGVRLARDVD